MKLKAELGLLRNSCSKIDSTFCEASDIWGHLLQDLSNITSWDDKKRKEFDFIVENTNSNFKISLERLREYLQDLNNKLDELQQGI